MLAVFFGNDQIKVRAEALAFANKIKTSTQTIEKIETEKCVNNQLLGLAESETLFGEVPVYVLDGILEDKEVFGNFFENVDVLAEGKVWFVLIADKILAEEKRKISKHTKEIFEFKKMVEKSFNPFSLAEAFLERDKRRLWLLYQEAKENKISNEEIIGILWWQLKTLRLAKKFDKAIEVGLKDFPFNKAKRALGKFKAGEIEEKSLELLKIYHEGHNGQVDLSLTLEKWCLS